MRLARILKRVRRIELITRGLVKETLGGQYHSRFKGQGIEFDDFREYQAGDDVRFIDWNVTARMDAPFVRKYEEERELTVLLLVDVSGSSDYGSKDDTKRELTAEMAGAFAFSACSNHDKVGLLLFTDQVEAAVPPRKGMTHALRLLRDILNLVPASPRSSLVPALEVVLKRMSHRSLVVIISDFLYPDMSWERRLRGVAAAHDVVAVRIADIAELSLPNVGRVALQDPETGQQHIINSSDVAVRQHYEHQLASRQQRVRDILDTAGVEILEVTTGENYIPALKAFFKGRKQKR